MKVQILVLTCGEFRFSVVLYKGVPREITLTLSREKTASAWHSLWELFHYLERRVRLAGFKVREKIGCFEYGCLCCEDIRVIDIDDGKSQLVLGSFERRRVKNPSSVLRAVGCTVLKAIGADLSLLTISEMEDNW